MGCCCFRCCIAGLLHPEVQLYRSKVEQLRDADFLWCRAVAENEAKLVARERSVRANPPTESSSSGQNTAAEVAKMEVDPPPPSPPKD